MSTKLDSGKLPHRDARPIRVAICVPSGDMVHADFSMALAAMAYQCGPVTIQGKKHEPIELALINVKDSLVMMARNALVDEAQKLGVDYVLFLDSDMVFHPWTIRQLIERDVDIVGGTYVKRRPPHTLLGKALDGRMLEEAIAGQQVGGDRLYEASGIPGGCMLIKMGVFEKLQKPYFQTPAQITDGVAWVEGEDYFFCRTAREAGFKVWIDWPVSFTLSHIGQEVFKIPSVEIKPEAGNAIVH
ncbi:hypothetical protein [Paraburkholderia phenazinium]|uniref:Glycosyl transferase family 2 n=1 Tax=Paraburkholderia phenazinium TaxID=60549 RepID=A0A1N6KPC2_9BURK|nr:hypothetical protein [Paraburkholderia phenazinium]SIO58388.1 hypothetical protein SAMN05444165_4126 [Paraburkholderia phenazinium]